MKKMLITSFFAALVMCAFVLYPGTTSALCIKVPKANIRTGPGLNYAVAWEVYQYMPLKKVGASLGGGWYAVEDVDGDVLWVYKALVTSKYRCAVVEGDQVNVRKGPGSNYSKNPLGPVEKYYTFKVLKTKGSWAKVTDGSNLTGWIHRDYIWIQ